MLPQVIRELSGMILSRGPKLCNFLEWRGLKVVYKRYLLACSRNFRQPFALASETFVSVPSVWCVFIQVFGAQLPSLHLTCYIILFYIV